MNILLINQYSGNKGDRAVLYAMCRLLKSRFPESTITVSTSDASLWKGYEYYSKENIKFIPWGWDYDNTGTKNPYWAILRKFQKYTFTAMREAYLRGISVSRFFVNPLFRKAVKNADIVISVGGHHYTTILSRDLVCGLNFDAMSVLMHKPLICFSQSFGPFKFYNPRNQYLTERILSNSILMPREDKSANEIKGLLKDNCKIIQTFESVLTLSKNIEYLEQTKRDNAVGIAIYCAQQRNEDEKKEYQKRIALFCDHVINHNYQVRFFPMEIKGSGPDDRPFINEIISQVQKPDKCDIYIDDMETLDHLREVSKCKIFLGHKTHSTIFALVTGTPLIGLAYHPKTVEFLKQFDLENNVVIDSQISDSTLCDMFDNLSEKLKETGRLQYNKSLEFASKIEEDLFKAIELVNRK